MNILRSVSPALGIGCLALGLMAALSGGGPVEQVVALGHALVIAGAIIVAGVLISSAIVGKSSKE
jgi:hypothetical protein